MIKALRKKHLIIWKVLGFLLPAGIIIAWSSIPEQLPQRLLQPFAMAPLPVVLKTLVKENYTVSVRSNKDQSQLQLEWIFNNFPPYPAATIYAGENLKNPNESKLVGRIEAGGTSYFLLDSTFRKSREASDHFILYDFIHGQVIDSINFKQ